jgi:peptide-methionine (S)-S-oxide reductase
MLRTLLALALLTAGAAAPRAADLQTAIVAGGCFWCVESDFDKVPGVVETVSGYTGGTLDNPSYQQVSAQTTGHFEAVRITYDADQVSYRQLVDVLWRTIDPTDNGGQFCDRGPSYRTAVFAADADEATTAKASRAEAQAALGQEIVTPILEAGTFWPAENYHQDYYHTNPVRYEFYRRACGRDARLRQLWGDKAFGAKS